MNLLDIIFLAILLFYFISGMYRGFITSTLSSVGFIASFYGAVKAAPAVTRAALSNSTLMAVLSQYLEPDSFFASARQAQTTVDTVVQGGENAIRSIIANLSNSLHWISDAFEMNIRSEKFAALNISSLSDYLDQTVWVAVFNVIGFAISFLLLYALCCLIVNLLDNVVRWPVVRGFDSLLGGLAGIIRGVIVCAMMMFVLPTAISIFSLDFAEELKATSKLYKMFGFIDFMSVKNIMFGLLKA